MVVDFLKIHDFRSSSWLTKFNSCISHGGRREAAPAGRPLASIHLPTHTQKANKYIFFLRFIISKRKDINNTISENSMLDFKKKKNLCGQTWEQVC